MKIYGEYRMAHGGIRPLALMISAALMATTLSARAVTHRTDAVTGHIPEATPVLDNLTPDVGDTLMVATHFSDPDGDAEDTTSEGTTYQWQKEDTTGSGKYVDITGQTGKTYTATAADMGKKIRVSVIPRTAPSITDPFEGKATLSNIALVSDSKMKLVSVTLNDAVVSKTANGVDIFTYTAVVTNENGKAMNGATVNWAVDNTDAVLSGSTSTTDTDGKATIMLSSTRAVADVQISASVNNGEYIAADSKVSFVAGPADAVKSTAVDCKGLAGTTFQCSVTLRDKYSNPVSGADVDMTVAYKATTTAGKTDVNGIASVAITPDESVDAVKDNEANASYIVNNASFALTTHARVTPLIRPLNQLDKSILSWSEMEAFILPLKKPVQFVTLGNKVIDSSRWTLTATNGIPTVGTTVMATETKGSAVSGTLTFTDNETGVTQTSPTVSMLAVAKFNVKNMALWSGYPSACKSAGHHDGLRGEYGSGSYFVRSHNLTGETYTITAPQQTIITYNYKTGFDGIKYYTYLTSEDGSTNSGRTSAPLAFTGVLLCK